LQLARTQDATLVVDGHLVVASLVQHNNVVGVPVVDNTIGFQAGHTGRVKGTFVLPRAQGNHALNHDLKGKIIYKVNIKILNK